jgi:hypothetical protein
VTLPSSHCGMKTPQYPLTDEFLFWQSCSVFDGLLSPPSPPGSFKFLIFSNYCSFCCQEINIDIFRIWIRTWYMQFGDFILVVSPFSLHEGLCLHLTVSQKVLEASMHDVICHTIALDPSPYRILDLA